MISAELYRAGNIAAGVLVEQYQKFCGGHVETVIAAASALAGEYALRSRQRDIPGLGWVDNDQVDELLFDRKSDNATTLWSLIAYNALQAGAPDFSLPDPRKVAENTMIARGAKTYPALSVPDEHHPRDWPPNAGPRIRNLLVQVLGREVLSDEQMAIAMAMAVGLLIKSFPGAIRPHFAATLALEVMIGVSRMAPLNKLYTGFDAWKATHAEPSTRTTREWPFKKPAQRETGAASPGQEPMAQAHDSKESKEAAILRAIKKITDMLITGYKDKDGNVHPQTVIGAAAALAGEYALRTVAGNQLPDKGWVVGNAINVLIFEDQGRPGVKLWPIIAAGAMKAGVRPDELPDPVKVVARTASKIGSSPFPPLTVANEHYPTEWSPNACPRFRAQFVRIAEEEALDPLDRAVALASFIGALIYDSRLAMPPRIGATLALEIMIGVSRMAPLTEEIS